MSAKEVEEIIANLGNITEKIAGKTVLVTGGSGFLGSWLCDVLARGYVTCWLNSAQP